MSSQTKKDAAALMERSARRMSLTYALVIFAGSICMTLATYEFDPWAGRVGETMALSVVALVSVLQGPYNWFGATLLTDASRWSNITYPKQRFAPLQFTRNIYLFSGMVMIWVGGLGTLAMAVLLLLGVTGPEWLNTLTWESAGGGTFGVGVLMMVFGAVYYGMYFVAVLAITGRIRHAGVWRLLVPDKVPNSDRNVGT